MLGKEHPDTLTSVSNLSIDAGASGKVRSGRGATSKILATIAKGGMNAF